jgi:NADH-quinone oxidoreductase subunit J
VSPLPALLAQTGQAAGQGSAEFVVFWVTAVVALGTGISMVLMRNAVHAALMLVLNFFSIAVIYAVLEAQFVATVQIIVYAGAIMVLFLFVLMLLGVDTAQPLLRGMRGQKPVAALLALALLGGLTVAVAGPYLGPESVCPDQGTQAATSEHACAGLEAANSGGNVAALGDVLFTDYVWPFEVTSVLLVIAAVGAMVLGRRHERPQDLVDGPEASAAVVPTRPPDAESEPVAPGGERK